MYLKVDNLEKLFRDHHGISQLCLDIGPGQILGVVGKNGAGKTTLVKSIMNWISLDTGEVTFFGRYHLPADRELVMQRVGYVCDVPILFEEETVAEMLDYVSSFYPTWDFVYEAILIGEFNLDRNARISELSRGMKRKLSLVLSMAYRPDLLIMDEATSGLDPDVRETLLKMLIDYVSDSKRSVLYITHYLEEVEQIATHVMIIDQSVCVFNSALLSLEQDFKVYPLEALDKIQTIKNIKVINNERSGNLIADFRNAEPDLSTDSEDLGGGLLHLEDLFFAISKEEVD